MPMMTLVMTMCEHQQFYIFIEKVQQYGAQCIIAVGLFSFYNILFNPDHRHGFLQTHSHAHDHDRNTSARSDIHSEVGS